MVHGIDDMEKNACHNADGSAPPVYIFLPVTSRLCSSRTTRLPPLLTRGLRHANQANWLACTHSWMCSSKQACTATSSLRSATGNAVHIFT